MLENVLYMPSMHYNIISLQRLRAAYFVYIFNEIPRKTIIKNVRGGMVALMTESKSGRLTLDCKILSTTTPLPSSRRVEVFGNPLAGSASSQHRSQWRGGPTATPAGGRGNRDRSGNPSPTRTNSRVRVRDDEEPTSGQCTTPQCGPAAPTLRTSGGHGNGALSTAVVPPTAQPSTTVPAPAEALAEESQPAA